MEKTALTLNEALLVLEKVQGIEMLTQEENEALEVLFNFTAARADRDDFDATWENEDDETVSDPAELENDIENDSDELPPFLLD